MGPATLLGVMRDTVNANIWSRQVAPQRMGRQSSMRGWSSPDAPDHSLLTFSADWRGALALEAEEVDAAHPDEDAQQRTDDQVS